MLVSSCQQLITLMRFYSSQRDASSYSTMSNWVSDGLTVQLISVTFLDGSEKGFGRESSLVFPLRSHLGLCLGSLEIQRDFIPERLRGVWPLRRR